MYIHIYTNTYIYIHIYIYDVVGLEVLDVLQDVAHVRALGLLGGGIAFVSLGRLLGSRHSACSPCAYISSV